jgi:hypothetical protein
MTTTAPSTRPAPAGTLFGGRHYAYIAQFLSGMGSLRQTIEQIACILAADNPHFDQEGFGREAGLERAPVSFTPDEIRANLVTADGIARRLGLRSGKLVATWRERYDDFPRPFLEGMRGRSGAAARHARYWWPDVKAFCERHGLPRRPRSPALSAAQIAEAQRRRDAGEPVSAIAAKLGVPTRHIYRVTSKTAAGAIRASGPQLVPAGAGDLDGQARSG